MKHIIFADVDGTLYDWRNRNLSEQTKKDIKKAQLKGIEIVLCTGNPYLNKMKLLMDELDIRYIIGANGSIIVDRKEEKVLYETYLDKEIANVILKEAIEIGVKTNWYNESGMLVCINTSDETKEQMKDIACLKELPKNYTKVDHHISKFEMNGTVKELDEIVRFLKDYNVTTYRMHNTFLEVISSKVSKGIGIKRFNSLFNIDPENTMSIGDSRNDSSMFRVTKYSYAMANADKRIKSLAKYHTAAVDQNGFGEATIDFMYRERLTDNFENNR